MSVWRNLGKILDGRPPHNWDYDVEGVRFCTVCQIPYRVDYAIRKGLPFRQVRKPESVKSDQQHQQQRSHREREEREKREREEREKRERENREKQQREDREKKEREKRERERLDRERQEREREEEEQERRQRKKQDQQIQKRREALELKQLQLREDQRNMRRQKHRELQRRAPQQIHYDYQEVNQFNEIKSQLPRANHHESNISQGSRHGQQNIFSGGQSLRSEQAKRESQKIKDRGSRISGSQSSNLSEASIRENLQLFLCPIDFYLMEDPWVTSCGHTFQKKAILRYLLTNDKCPVCRHPLESSLVHQNIIAKQQIENFKRRLERHNVDINDYL